MRFVSVLKPTFPFEAVVSGRDPSIATMSFRLERDRTKMSLCMDCTYCFALHEYGHNVAQGPTKGASKLDGVFAFHHFW